MPQLDLYLWGNTLILFVSVFLGLYFFFVYYFLIGVAKIFYVRKKFYSRLELQNTIAKKKLNFISSGIFFESFLVFVNDRNDLLQIQKQCWLLLIRYSNLVHFFDLCLYNQLMIDFFYELALSYNFLLVRVFALTDDICYRIKYLSLSLK